MPRPGPLMPLPLDQYLLPTQAVSKRPHSPGGPTPFSPAKRRLLNEEGLFKTPQPRSTDPSRFSRVLAGPGSPARVLDFGSIPRNSAGDPQKRPSTSHPGGTVPNPSVSASSSAPSSSKTLAPSPEFKGRVTRQSRTGKEDVSVNPFDFDSISSMCESPTSSNLTFVPRELPTQSDPRSIHYPGFTVHQDPHVVIYPPSTGDALGQEDMEEDAQMSKENIVPRRRVKKMATEPLAKTNPFSPSGTTARMTQSLYDTPRASTRAACLRSPSMTPQTAIHKGMRQLMKDELDIGEGDYY